MLQNVRDYLSTWVDFVIANPAVSRGESVNHLQIVANVTNAEGNDWFNAVAVMLASIGAINNGTYGVMRNDIVNSGDVVSKNLFNAVFQAIRELPETAAVGIAIRNFERQRRIVEITADIQQVRTYRDALPNPPAITDREEERSVRKALVDGIQSLRQEREELRGRVVT